MALRTLSLSVALLSSLAFVFAACSGDDGAKTSTSAATTGEGGAGAGSGGSGSGSTTTTGGGGNDPGALGGALRHGVNFGFPNPAFADPDLAWLAREAGSDSARLKLPEYHLEQWGYDIEVGDMKSYSSLGMDDHIAFLIGVTAAHSTAPAGTPNWQLDNYLPANLYEPILLGDGTVNPNNYWAAYVYKTVDTYKDWVHTWEVWNEPDWVSDYKFTQTWTTDPPTKDQLVRFGGSIFDYIRMLRITTEAAKKADPNAKIAVGGLGYPTFLAALLRYTDNPVDGSKTAEYPELGGAYFDVLSYHYYPIYTPGASDDGAKGFISLKDEMAKVMADAGVSGKGWTVTETGGPHIAVDNQPGGTEYAVNYIMKAMVEAQANGIARVDWFALSDGAKPGDSQNSYDYMGLYLDVSMLAKKEDGVKTETGWAYRTLGTLLEGALYAPDATKALALPDTAAGAAFKRTDGKEALVLWAKTSGMSETASASVSITTTKQWTAHAWDFSQTGKTTDVVSAGGSATIELTGAPQILVEK